MTTPRPYQLVEGVFELLQTVDELVLRWRFGAQSQDALWWTEMETQPSFNGQSAMGGHCRPNRDRSEQEVMTDRQEVVMLLPSQPHLQDSSSCSSWSSSCGRARRTPQPPSAVWLRRTRCRPGCGSGFAAKIKVRRTVGLRRSIRLDAVMYQASEVTTHHISVHSGGRHLHWPVLLCRPSLLLVCRQQNQSINKQSRSVHFFISDRLVWSSYRLRLAASICAPDSGIALAC